jgi:hypothetical protein
MRYQITIELHKFLPCPVRGKQRISPLHSTRVLLLFNSYFALFAALSWASEAPAPAPALMASA